MGRPREDSTHSEDCVDDCGDSADSATDMLLQGSQRVYEITPL